MIEITEGRWPEAKPLTVKNKQVESTEFGRVLPRQINTGMMRGTQTHVGLDGSKVTVGIIPGTNAQEFGIAFFNSEGKLVRKILGPTGYIFDTDTGNDISQEGILPDGTVGRADSKAGESVSDAIT